MTQQLNYDAGNKGDYNHKTCNANMAPWSILTIEDDDDVDDDDGDNDDDDDDDDDDVDDDDGDGESDG